MDSKVVAILSFFFIINAAAFFLMLLDKAQSRKNGAERISEGLLFFLAVAFGSAGVFAGMLTFRHKTQKWYFLLGVPLAFVQNCALLYFIYTFWTK